VLFAPLLAACGSLQPSPKTFRIKVKLAKKQKQNRPIPHWIDLSAGQQDQVRLPLCVLCIPPSLVSQEAFDGNG